jgi:FMN phosphatase YigB (HAD superfamily)
MIKTVIFDLGKVIVPFDFGRGYRAMESLCGFRAADIPARIATTDLVQRFEMGQVQPEDFVRQLSEILGMQVDYAKFCEIWSSIFLPDTLVPESLLEGLKKRQRLLLLSNTNAIHFDMIRQNYPLLRHFDNFILSYEVGALKPSPVIYERAIEAAECRPEECFYTDDIPAYVTGARQLGIDAVQFHSREQLEQELLSRGVRWD